MIRHPSRDPTRPMTKPAMANPRGSRRMATAPMIMPTSERMPAVNRPTSEMMKAARPRPLESTAAPGGGGCSGASSAIIA